MKRTILAAVLAMSTVSAFAQPAPSFNDFPEQFTRTAPAVEHASLGANPTLPQPSFVDYPVIEAHQGLAGRAATEARSSTANEVVAPVYQGLPY